MTSPDIDPYVGLTLVGKDPQDLVQQALDARTTYAPEYDPNEGDVDLEQLGALVLPVAEIGYALDRAGDGWVEADAAFLGLERAEGTPAAVTLEFTVAPDPLGVDIPAGYLASLDLGNGETVTFATDDAVVSAADATTVPAAATATTTGSDPNGVPSGTVLVPQTPHAAVTGVKTDSTVAGGTDPEDDASFQAKYVAYKATLSASLINGDQFTNYTVSALGAFRVLTRENWNVTTSANGHVTVFAAKPGGVFYTSDEKTAMAATLDARSVVGLVPHAADPQIIDVDVAVQVETAAGYDEATVETNITEALTEYLSPDTWAWGGTVYYNELISVIDRVEGVARVVDLTTPAADVTLTGAAPLARLDDLTVTFL
jgi:uncharacterized phage protein gp47/JayE